MIASIASLSVFMIGFAIQSENPDTLNSPFKRIETSSDIEKGYFISSDGIILSSSYPTYHEPQVTGKDNPYEKAEEEQSKEEETKNEEKSFSDERQVKRTMTVELTGYSSTVDQTNSEPFITASGHRVRDGIVAANHLDFGTEIRIPEYFGDKVFVVKDRMNTRYTNAKNDSYEGYVDIWFPTRWEANNFGRVHGEIEILK